MSEPPQDPDTLTPEEIEALRQNRRHVSEKMQGRFSHLKSATRKLTPEEIEALRENLRKISEAAKGRFKDLKPKGD